MLFLLKYFKDCEFDLILDDYYREDEKQITKMWEKLLLENNIEYKTELVKSEKGLYILRRITYDS